MYRRLVNKKRCVVLFNGYYEWQKKENIKSKQPYYFTPEYIKNDNIENDTETKTENDESDEPLMFMAALWDTWYPPNDRKNPLFSVSIITTDSNKDVAFCHHRMPLLMTKQCVSKWLDVENCSIDQCFEMIAEQQKFIKIKHHAVPREVVGNTKVKGIECIQSLEQYEAKKKKTGIRRFFKTAKPEKKTPSKSKKVDKNKNENQMKMDENKNNMTENDENLKKAIQASKDYMNVDDDDELNKAIKASEKSYKMEQEKRGKKRRLDELDELEELSISEDVIEQNPEKKQKLNNGSQKKMENTKQKQSAKRKLRKR